VPEGRADVLQLLRSADLNAVEVEGGEGLSGGQTRFGEMALDAASKAIGDVLFGERGEEAGGRPSLAIPLCRTGRRSCARSP
jgi:hypothetical protein